MGKKDVGVQQERECRDVIFLIAMVFFWAGSWTVAGIAYDNGDPRKLWYPKDSFNNTCGLGEFEDIKYLYFPDVTDVDIQLCVEECPIVGEVSALASCDVEDQVCLYGVEPSADIGPPLYDQSPGCFCTYASEPLLRRCLPQELSGEGEQAAEDIQKVIKSRDEFAQAFTDVSNSWEVILGTSIFAVGLCFMWLICVSIAAWFMVWWTVLGMIVCAIAITAYLWSVSAELQSEEDVSKDEPDSFVDTKTVVLVITIIVTCLSGALILSIIYLRRKINLAIEIVREASKAVRAMPMIIFFPIFLFSILAGYFAWWLSVAVFLASMEPSSKYPEEDLDTLKVYHLFGFFWMAGFIIALNQVTIAGAIGSWYWTADKNYLPAAPVTRSFTRALRYHLGSIALGSLILAFIQTIRAVIAMMQKKLKGKNQCVQYLIACMQCFFACVERFLKFFNKNAYIMVAIYGGSFCSSARRAFKLVINNIVRVAAVSFIGDFLIFLGKLSVCIIAGITAAQVLKEREDVAFWLFPVIFVMAFAYIISSAFMAVYEMAIDTILLCFLDEYERQQSSNAPSTVYMSDNLKDFMDRTYQESKKEIDEQEENNKL